MRLTNTPTNALQALQTPCEAATQTTLQTPQTSTQTPCTHTPHTPQSVCAARARTFCPPANTAALRSARVRRLSIGPCAKQKGGAESAALRRGDLVKQRGRSTMRREARKLNAAGRKLLQTLCADYARIRPGRKLMFRARKRFCPPQTTKGGPAPMNTKNWGK